MEWGQQMRKHQQNARDAMYQNPNYNFERRERKTLIIDQSLFPDSDRNTINTTLLEPLIIDKLSDVFLESVMTYGSATKNLNNNYMAFLLSIDQFNINTNIASNSSDNTLGFNKILIPNENNTDNASASQIHKAKKLNYVCSINPTKISKITGTISNLNNGNIWYPGSNDAGRRLIVELVIVARD